MKNEKAAVVGIMAAKLAATKNKKRSQSICGIVRFLPEGDFLEISRTKDTVGLLSMGALFGIRAGRWKNKKVRITMSEAK